MNFSMNLPVAGHRGKRRLDADVRITVMQSQKGERIRFIFKSDAFPEMQGENVVAFEPRGSRLYFGFSKVNGYRLQKGKTTAAMLVAQPGFVKKLRKYVGDFEAKYDSEERCHYIEIEDVPKEALLISEPIASVEEAPRVTVCSDECFDKLKEVFIASILDALAQASPDLHQILKNAVKQGFEEVGK